MPYLPRHRLWAALLMAATTHSSCIHTDEARLAKVAVDETLPLQAAQQGPLHIEHLIYTEAQLPLGEFFSRLTAGEFAEAFRSIDLRYQPATTDNDAIAKLMDSGLVPVYVRVTNTSDRPVPLRSEAFQLVSSSTKIPAYSADELPRAFQSLNPTAIGANVYNTGVVVVAAAAMITVMIFATHGSSGACCLDSPFRASAPLYNDTKLTTTITYENYLFPDRAVPPGATVKGLVFFQAPAGTAGMRLEWAEAAGTATSH